MPRKKRNETGNQFEGLIGQGVDFENEVKMADLLNDMQSSKTRHHGSLIRMFTKQDSKEYQDVEKTLRNVVFDINTNFTDDVAANEKMITVAMGDYYKLLAACEKYINKKGGTSDKGAARKDKVKQIQDYAQRDLSGIEQAFYAMKSMNAQQQSTLTWDEILHSARMDIIEVEDYFDERINSGNAAKTGDLIGKRFKEGFFSPDHKKKFEDSEGVDLKMNAFSNKNENEKVSDVTVNVANRNVATSRVANLIGIGGIVEQSKSVKILDKKTNTTKTGSLMSKARGNEVTSELAQNRLAMSKIESVQERENIAKGKISSTAQKELSSLQVLDYLCGQGDRHRANYFAEKDSSDPNSAPKYTHIHGIDNDCSFSTGVDFEEMLRLNGGLLATNQHRRAVVDGKGNLTIPHMDEQLAKNILNLKKEELVFSLKGVIEDPFIEYAIKRLELLQKGIKNEFKKKNSSVFVGKDEDWNNETMEDFLNQSYRRKVMAHKDEKEHFKSDRSFWQKFTFDQGIQMTMGDNYVAALVDDIMGFDRQTYSYETFNDQIAQYMKSLENKRVPKEQRLAMGMEKFGITAERVRAAYKWI